MSTKITAIRKDAVHKICSGQVVLNLATAIKELIENSLDAKATAIEVRLKEYGSELIEVSDNGIGIHPNNFEALALKHHTSKLEDFNDLVDVETFGFRGEALSSLCAVGELTVITRHETESCGSKLTFNYMGILHETQPSARQIGTTVSLTNLFSSLPVRQKEFHRNLKKEFGKAAQLLSAYCLSSTNVKFTCINQLKKGGRITFLSTQNNKSVRENISCVFGSKQLINLLKIVDVEPDEEILNEFGVENNHVNDIKIEGYISSCEHGCGRSTTDRQFFYINSRPCDLSKVMKLTNEIYHKYNQQQYPFIFLNIIMPKQLIDVNVTPDKRLIFLQNEKSLLAVVKSSLTKIFENIPSTYRLNNLPTSLLVEKESSQTKIISTSSILSKWKHSNDKNINENINDRKRIIEERSEHRDCKQMKLDRIFKKSYSDNNSKKFRDNSNFSNRTDTETVDASNEEIKSHRINNEKDENDTLLITEELKPQCETEFIQTIQTQLEIQDCFSCDENFTFAEKNKNISSNSEVISSEPSENLNRKSKNCTDTHFSHSNSSDTVADVYDDINPNQIIEVRKFRIMETSIKSIMISLSAKKSRRNDNQRFNNKFYTEIDPNKNQLAEEELKKEISKDTFNKMKIIGQFNLGFIITKYENDLFIIDQHATDEKYNFETLQHTTSLTSQKLVVPQDLNLTFMNECILIDNIEILKKNGFEFSIDTAAEATKRIKLVSIPVSRNWQFGKEDVDEMLFMLQDAPNTLCRPTRIRSMFASRACRKSVMIGTSLTVSDMRRLVNNMGLIEQPWNCPHGRPTMRHLVNLSLLQ